MSGSLQVVNNTYLAVLNIIPTSKTGFVMLDSSERASIVDSLIVQLQQDGLSPKETLTVIQPKDFIKTQAVQLVDFMLEAPSTLTDYCQSVDDLGVQGLALSVSQTKADQDIPNPPDIVTAIVNAEMTAISQAGANSIKSVLLNGQNYSPLYIAGSSGQEIAIVVQIALPAAGGQSFSLDIPGTIAFSPFSALEVESAAGLNIPASLESSSASFSIIFPTSTATKTPSPLVPTRLTTSSMPTPPSVSITNPAGWRSENRPPIVYGATTDCLDAVWGSSSSDVFAVGQEGTILHYDGKAWSTMTSGTTGDLWGVWGSSSSDIFAVGDRNTIQHYDGKAWSSVTSGMNAFYYGVWGSSSSDVFAVGVGGVIIHYDGKTWSSMTSGTTCNLCGVWGSSSSDVFAVGQEGTILHYDGKAWSIINTNTNKNSLIRVWGSSSSDIFAVGVGGTLLHYDGKVWNTMISGTDNTLWGLWGSSPSDVFAMGEKGTILYYDGKTWSTMISGTDDILCGVWGNSSSNIFAVGIALLHYNP
jgi:hypothetical protein